MNRLLKEKLIKIITKYLKHSVFKYFILELNVVKK